MAYEDNMIEAAKKAMLAAGLATFDLPDALLTEISVAALTAACDQIGWTEINAFHAELNKGQDYREDGGGFFVRCISALFGKKTDEVCTWRDAARAMLRAAGYALPPDVAKGHQNRSGRQQVRCAVEDTNKGSLPMSYASEQAILNAQWNAAVEAQETEAARRAPHVMMRPRLFLDGNAYCALYGENLMDGVAGFGYTPEAAMLEFDKAWRESGEPVQHKN